MTDAVIRSGTGNLLTTRVDALVNPVNCEGVMGKGLALQFKQAWPAMFVDYQKAAKAGRVEPGRIHVWATGLAEGPRYILNLPTKRRWREPSRIEDIDAGLTDLVRQVATLGLRSIAVPPLGAGNGGLDWAVVKPRIVAALGALDNDVVLFEPAAAPAHADRPVGTPRPALTPARAAILGLMWRYAVLDYALTQLEVQKLAWFLQAAGQPLRLRYVKQTYGPYADGLYHVLRTMDGHQLRGVDDRSPRALIQLDEDSRAAIDEHLARDPATQARFDRVAHLIDGFETPYGMELLATVHWVALHDASARTSWRAALAGVVSWSERKARVLKPEHVEIAWQRLSDEGWLAA